MKITNQIIVISNYQMKKSIKINKFNNNKTNN